MAVRYFLFNVPLNWSQHHLSVLLLEGTRVIIGLFFVLLLGVQVEAACVALARENTLGCSAESPAMTRRQFLITALEVRPIVSL